VTAETFEYLEFDIPRHLEEMWEILQGERRPDIDVGKHCKEPHQCPFFGYCHRDGSRNPAYQLPRITAKALRELDNLGARDIQDIPVGFTGLSATQQRIRDSVVSGQPYISGGLEAELRKVQFPIHFLDFETVGPALPLYSGNRPYQTIPFQWSLHILNSDGKLHHQGFLHDGSTDPRREFVESLLKAVAPEGSIAVYSHYEKGVLNRLAELFPRHEVQLSNLVDRLYDLLPVVRNHYYHPDFRGSFSIKRVLPTLVPGMDYKHLEIQDGNAASFAFFEMVNSKTNELQREKIRQALWNYCAQDTKALVQVFSALCSMATMESDDAGLAA